MRFLPDSDLKANNWPKSKENFLIQVLSAPTQYHALSQSKKHFLAFDGLIIYIG
jgi:hypothetical protein